MKEWTGHVTEEWLDAWITGQLNEAEQQKMYAHLGTCDYCAEQFAAYLEQDLIEPPLYLQKEIIERSKRLDVQTVRTVYQTSKHVQFLLYSLKVGLAVATSLFLLSFSARFDEMEIDQLEFPQKQQIMEESHISIIEKLDENSHKLNNFLQNFTGWLRITEYEEIWND